MTGSVAGLLAAFLAGIATFALISSYSEKPLPYIVLYLILLRQVPAGLIFGGTGGVLGSVLPFRSAPWILGAAAGVIGAQVIRALYNSM